MSLMSMIDMDADGVFSFYPILLNFHRQNHCKWKDLSLNKSTGWFLNFQELLWFSMEINIFIPVNATLGCKRRIPYLVIFLCFFLVSRVWDILQALTLQKDQLVFSFNQNKSIYVYAKSEKPKSNWLLYRYPAYFQVRVLFLGRECFESLPESERQQIYDLHQQDLMERSV